MFPLKSSRAVMMLQHYMYESPVTYANLYLLYGDAADYLRQPFSPTGNKDSQIWMCSWEI